MWYLFLGLQKNCLLKVFTLRVFLFYQQCYFFFFGKIETLCTENLYSIWDIIYQTRFYICLNNWSQFVTRVHCTESWCACISYFITDDGPQSRTTVSPEEQIIQQRGRLRSSPRRKALTSNSPRIKVTEMGKNLNWFIIIFDNAKQKCKSNKSNSWFSVK